MSGRQCMQVVMASALAWAAVACGGGQAPPETAPATAASAPPPADSAPKADWYAQHHGLARQSCGHGCRYAAHQHSEVELLLGPHGDVVATDHGERLEESATVVGKAGRLTRWLRRWRGSWTEGSGRINVTLTPESLECERMTGDGARDSPCNETALNLVCERAKVTVSEPKPQLLPGWVCIPQQRVRAGEMTPLPWVFGDTQWLLALERGPESRESRALRQYALGDINEYPKRPRPDASGQTKNTR